MAKPVPDGWDITDEEAAEVLRLSNERDDEVWRRWQAATYREG